MSLAWDEYPLYCTYGLGKDDFAGWFSVSDSKQCNDFCFWRQPDEYYSNDDFNYTTADPHQTTQTTDGGQWGCIMDAVDDDITWRNAFEMYEDYNADGTRGVSDHLRCSRGPAETLSSSGQDIFSSVPFWYTVLVIMTVAIIGEMYWFLRRRRTRRNETQDQQCECESNEGGNENEAPFSTPVTVSPVTNPEGSSLMDDSSMPVRNYSKDGTDHGPAEDENPRGHDEAEQISESQQSSLMRVRQWMRAICTCKCHPMAIKIGIPTFFLALNLAICFIIFASIVSLLELQYGVDLSHALKTVTPSCTATEKLCPDGNAPIDRASIDRAEVLQEGFKPFSYLIASDSQLNWYNGESAYIGKENYPPPCSKRDSCGSCTAKFGSYTNMQMKNTIEKIIATTSTSSTDDESLNVNVTALVMNGDLTQYFHRREELDYKSLYHNIRGLKQYFPSLGNHDYDQGSATYDNDEWISPHYCNGKHAIAYFRSSFCNKIPKFEAKDRVTRYNPQSLAYSWEEGFYHFVHLHYYPFFESAGLGISSSLEWLEKDLKLASEKNLTTILFVHAAGGLSEIMEDFLIHSRVAVIFAGHRHRCFGNKCSYIKALNTYQAEQYVNGTSSFDRVEKCFPASAALCGRNPNGNSLFYLSDMDDDLVLPDTKLKSKVPRQTGKCPVGKYATFINETDNTALCTERRVQNVYPFTQVEQGTNRTSIPIIWSGSSSFETLLKADFLNDRIVINFMTATSGNEGKRYIDAYSVPNAVYPFHSSEDLEEMIIYI